MINFINIMGFIVFVCIMLGLSIYGILLFFKQNTLIKRIFKIDVRDIDTESNVSILMSYFTLLIAIFIDCDGGINQNLTCTGFLLLSSLAAIIILAIVYGIVTYRNKLKPN